MARPLRIEFPGALYHVTSRGDRREAIYDDDVDRVRFLNVFADVVKKENWLCHGYCLMTNHYHLIVETPEGNLVKGMRQLNGVFSQASNRRHCRTGHVFQGRYAAILVDKDSYLLELARYVVLNPVRAGMVTNAGDWPWSSYLAMVGAIPCPHWLSTDALLVQFGERRSQAIAKFQEFVAQGRESASIWASLRQQIYLGDEDFVQRSQARMDSLGDKLTIPSVQRRAPVLSLEEYARRCGNRDDAIVQAYMSGRYSYRDIGESFGLSRSTIRRVVRRNMTAGET